MSADLEKAEAPKKPEELRKCPKCRQTISDSFQARCPTCGHELNTAEDVQAVKDFFQKLDDVAQKEYEANKQREGQKKQKLQQPKAMVICEVAAITSLILIILHAAGLSEMLRDMLSALVL